MCIGSFRVLKLGKNLFSSGRMENEWVWGGWNKKRKSELVSFAIDPLSFLFDLLKFRSLGMWILSLKQSLERSLKQQSGVSLWTVFLYQSVNLVHCKFCQFWSEEPVEETNTHTLTPSVWKEELPRCSNFWCAPLGVAVRCCLQCWAAGALVQGYVACTKIQLVKCCLLSACVSGITSFFNGNAEFFKSFLCSVHQTQRAEGKILNSVHLFCTSQA